MFVEPLRKRHIPGYGRLRQGDTINASALSAMLQQIIANNRAGGWRKVKRTDESTNDAGASAT
jgi:hypothetical protein